MNILRTTAAAAIALSLGLGVAQPGEAHSKVKYDADSQYRITNTWTPRTVRPGRYVCVGQRSPWSGKRAAYFAVKTRGGRIIRNDFEYGRTARIYFVIKWSDRGKILDTTCARLIKQHRHFTKAG